MVIVWQGYCIVNRIHGKMNYVFKVESKNLRNNIKRVGIFRIHTLEFHLYYVNSRWTNNVSYSIKEVFKIFL